MRNGLQNISANTVMTYFYIWFVTLGWSGKRQLT